MTEEKIHRSGLKEKVIGQIADVLSQYPEIESAVLYGSRAKGNYRKGSDIDLTLKGIDISYRTLLKIECDIDDLLLPYLFDISIFTHIDNLSLIEHIDRVGIPLYQKETANLTTST